MVYFTEHDRTYGIVNQMISQSHLIWKSNTYTLTPVQQVCLIQTPTYSAYFSEALFKVVRQEAIEQRVRTGVGVRQDNGEEVDAGSDAGLWDDDHQVDHVDDEERQPAEHKHHHHPRHLALGTPTLGEACARSRGLHLQENS